MSLELATRLTEVLLALVLLQQSLEHLLARRPDPHHERAFFLCRIVLCALLIAGIAGPAPLIGLALLSLWYLNRFHGPYNGGSDRMGLLALWCLTLSRLAPEPFWREMALGYLGIQLMLSYFISGWVKVVNPDWRSGRALRDVFAFSAYPVSETLRGWADSPRLLFVAAWGVMLLELAFPLAMTSAVALSAALVLTATFHLANACLFGLNRFFWTWLATYPALLWLQARVTGA
ncbi:MAG: HTTM domain-containing protein [Burkholderiaceae bacterium]